MSCARAGRAVSERGRILAWWAYVALVIAIFEATFLLTNFAYAVGAALLGIAVLGLALKALVARLTRAAPGPRPAARDQSRPVD